MGRARQEEKQPKMTRREGVAEIVGLYRNEKLEKGKPMSWRGLGWGGGMQRTGRSYRY